MPHKPNALSPTDTLVDIYADETDDTLVDIYADETDDTLVDIYADDTTDTDDAVDIYADTTTDADDAVDIYDMDDGGNYSAVPIESRPGYTAEAEVSGGINVADTLQTIDKPRALAAVSLIGALEGTDLEDIERQLLDTLEGGDHPVMGEYYVSKMLEIRENPELYPNLSPLITGTEAILGVIPQTVEIVKGTGQGIADVFTVISACGQYPTKECIDRISKPIIKQRVLDTKERIAEAEHNSDDLSGMLKFLGHTVGFATDFAIDPWTYTNPIVSFINKGRNLIMATKTAQRISAKTGMSVKQVKYAFTHNKYGQTIVKVADEAWALFSTKHKLDKIKVGDKTAWEYQTKFRNLVAAARIRAVRDNKELQKAINSFAKTTNTPVDDINMFITEAVERGSILNIDLRHLPKESVEFLARSPKLREIVRGLQVKNEKQLIAEINAGIKVTKLEDSPLITAAGDTDLYLQYMNHAILPEAREIVLKSSDELAPVFIQKAGETKGNIFTTKHSSTWKRKKDWAGLTLVDINKLAKEGNLPGYEGTVFKKGFFQTDPAILQAIRDNKHYRTMAAVELADSIKSIGVSGDDIIKEAMSSGWKPHTKDAAKSADVALAYLKENNPDWSDLVMTKNKYTGGQAFPSDVATFIDNSLEFINSPKQMNIFRQGWEGITRWIKAWTLSIFPSYHTRNAVGNMFNNFVMGVEFKTYKDALHIQQAISKGRIGTFKLDTGQHVTYKQLRDWADANGVTGRGIFAIDIETSLTNELGKARWMTFSTENKAILIGKRVGENVEDNARMANFIDGLNKGMSPEKAGERVRYTLFDYSDLTSAEQAYMKNLMPFYTWSRKNIPFQVEQMIKQPGKYKAIDTAQREIEAAVEDAQPNEKYLAKWMLINMPTKVRLDDNDTPQYFLMGGWLPAADVWKLASAPMTVPKDLLHPAVASFIESMLRPVYKKNIDDPVGFVTLFGDRTIMYGDQVNYLGMTIDKSWAHYLDKIRVISTLDDFYQPFNKDRMKSPFAKPKTVGESMLRFWTGIKLHTVDLDKQKSFKINELRARIQHKKSILKDNIDYPNVRDDDFIELKALADELKTFSQGGLVSKEKPHDVTSTEGQMRRLLREQNKLTDLQLPRQSKEEWLAKVKANTNRSLDATAWAKGGYYKRIK